MEWWQYIKTRVHDSSPKSSVHDNTRTDINKRQHTPNSSLHDSTTSVDQNSSILARLAQAKLAYYCVQRGHFPFLKASGFSSIAALARRACSSFRSLSSLRSTASLLCCSSYRSFSVASSWRLFSTLSSRSASHFLHISIYLLSSSLISVSIHCSKSQSGGGVYKIIHCYIIFTHDFKYYQSK